MPFLRAHVPNVSVSCGTVADVRTMYGDFVVMMAVAAFMTTMNFFDSADTSAAARALGVRTNPARMST